MLHEDNILRACQDPAFLEKFWRYTAKGADDACWPWTRCFFKQRGKDTYGCITLPVYCRPRVIYQTHRISWIIANGLRPIPDGMFVCHSCDTMQCNNPAHLHLGTPADNLREAAERNRMPKGEDNGNVVLTAEKVREIRRRLATNDRRDVLAAEFGIAVSTLYQIRARRTWKGIEP